MLASATCAHASLTTRPFPPLPRSGDEETQEAQYSRLLIVKINEAESTATVKWSYGVGAYTPIYGDNDKMPTGNMLGTMWVGDMACKDWPQKEIRWVARYATGADSQVDRAVEKQAV